MTTVSGTTAADCPVISAIDSGANRNGSALTFKNYLATARLLRDTNVLWLSEEPQRFFAAFAAYAALFHAAEWNAQIADEPAIHPNRPRVTPLGNSMGATQILRPDAR